MGFRTPTNALALAIGGLAIAVAATGTSVAATGQIVNIADPTNASNVAKVDSSGRLLSYVGGVVSARPTPPATPVNKMAFVAANSVTPIIGPTTATIAITKFAARNSSANTGQAGTNFGFALTRVPTSSGTCGSTSAEEYSRRTVLPGSNVIDDYDAAPLVFKPAGTTPYCIGVYVFSESGTPSSYTLPVAQLTGYVVSGTYTASSPATRSTARTKEPSSAG